MMRKMVILCFSFLLMAGTVTASSINGNYHGNPIVRVIVDGKEVTNVVPAMIIDGTTLIPLRAVVDAFNAQTSWNQNTYIAEIKSNSTDKSEKIIVARFYAQLSSVADTLKIKSLECEAVFEKSYYGKSQFAKEILSSDLKGIIKGIGDIKNFQETIMNNLKSYESKINVNEYKDLKDIQDKLLNMTNVDMGGGVSQGLPLAVSSYYYLQNKDKLDWYIKSKNEIFNTLEELQHLLYQKSMDSLN